jgi:hypothetical protein
MDGIIALLRDNISAVFTLVGVMIGALLSFWSSSTLRRKESRLRITEKILDRRIQAHEEVARWAESLDRWSGIGYRQDDKRTNVLIPQFMRSAEEYREWAAGFSKLCERNRIWLSVTSYEMIELLRAYLAELESILARGHSENIWAVGVIIGDDFPALMASIQSTCYKYLFSGALELEVPEKTVLLSPGAGARRQGELADCILFSQHQRIERLVKTDPREVEQRLSFVIFDHFRRQYLDRDRNSETA